MTHKCLNEATITLYAFEEFIWLSSVQNCQFCMICPLYMDQTQSPKNIEYLFHCLTSWSAIWLKQSINQKAFCFSIEAVAKSGMNLFSQNLYNRISSYVLDKLAQRTGWLTSILFFIFTYWSSVCKGQPIFPCLSWQISSRKTTLE